MTAKRSNVRPNLIINLPMELQTFAAIGKACPEGAVIVRSENERQAYVYFDPEDVPAREGEAE